MFPYDYYILWTTPPALPSDPTGDPREPYFLALETHLKFLHASPPLISRILHIVIGVGLLGLFMKLYKMTEANMLFDGASLVLFMIGITVYIANIVKGLRTVTLGAYGGAPLREGETLTQKAVEGTEDGFIGREDSLRVLAASNTILALVLIGILVLAGRTVVCRAERCRGAGSDGQGARREEGCEGRERQVRRSNDR